MCAPGEAVVKGRNPLCSCIVRRNDKKQEHFNLPPTFVPVNGNEEYSYICVVS